MKKIRVSKTIVLLLLCLAISCSNAENEEWQHLDLQEDGKFGVSTNKAYQSLIADKKANTVIIAVLDAGIDTSHIDLKPNLWINKKELPNNGLDDDGNGYVDDLHGWNFTASGTETIPSDNSALTLLVRRDELRFSGKKWVDINPEDRKAFILYQKNKKQLAKELEEANARLIHARQIKAGLVNVLKQMHTNEPTQHDFMEYMPSNSIENRVRSLFIDKLKRKTFNEVYEEDVLGKIRDFSRDINYYYNLNYIPRLGKTIGNPDITGPDPLHGTHVAGIIAAVRGNDIGAQGIADHVLIMGLRCSSSTEKDVAMAIRYAVDNGASIINMSFGEDYTIDKDLVDKAIQYAETNDVLIVSAAGNSSRDLDKAPKFPNPDYVNGGRANAWINVGASDYKDDETLRVSFSNYGKRTVDVFAPGVRIYSCAPGSKYRRFDGTSMASPVVAGVAGLIRCYYPNLSATDVKEIILKTVTKTAQLKDKCSTGGVVNAYSALKLAANYKSKP